MIYVTNPLIMPLLLIIWSADLWLWLTAVSLIASRLRPGNSLSVAIRPIVHSLPNLVSRWLTKGTRRPMSGHTLWVATFAGVFVLRCLLLYVVMLMQPH